MVVTRWLGWKRGFGHGGVALGLALLASCGEASESPAPSALPPLRCIGTIWYCTIVPQTDCANTPGCDWIAAKTPCASTLSCGAQGGDPAQCDGTDGCHWEASTPSTCSGEPRPCHGLRTDLCAVVGCGSAPACATPCDGLDQESCGNRDFCSWLATSRLCTSAVSPATGGPCAERSHDECIADAADGCIWSEAFCEGTPQPCSALTTFPDCSGAGCAWSNGTGFCVRDAEPCASRTSNEACNATATCAWSEGSCAGILDCTKISVEQCERLPNCSLTR